MSDLALAPLLYALSGAAASVVSVSASLVLLAAATPDFRRDIERRMGPEGGLSVVAGLALLAHAVVAFLLLAPAGRLGLAAIGLLGSGTMGLALLGLSVVALRVGRRVGRLRASGEPFPDLAAVLLGGPLLLLTGFVPLFGWAVLTYAVTLGLGATVRALLGYAAGVAFGARAVPRSALGPR